MLLFFSQSIKHIILGRDGLVNREHWVFLIKLFLLHTVEPVKFKGVRALGQPKAKQTLWHLFFMFVCLFGDFCVLGGGYRPVVRMDNGDYTMYYLMNGKCYYVNGLLHDTCKDTVKVQWLTDITEVDQISSSMNIGLNH